MIFCIGMKDSADMNNFDNEAHAKYKSQVVYSNYAGLLKNAFQYVNSIQPSLPRLV